MERIIYQRTLDVHKNGVQFTLQGVETGDNLSRVIEISLMASGDAIDFPLEKLLPVMYVRTPNAIEPSIIECTIKDNVVVYEVLPIVEEGITEMQLKLIETSPDGATRVLFAPRFAVEVTKSISDDSEVEQTSSFTALENAVAKAKSVYDQRFLRMELDSECIFRAYYADGTTYETDVLQKLFRNGNVLLSESWAKGGTGMRAGEDTNNSMYYSNVSKSAALEAKDVTANNEELLEEVRLHGVYTAFSVDFETGEVEYVSPSYKFKVNMETGDLDAEGQAYSFEDDIFRLVEEWLATNGVVLTDLQRISEEHTETIDELKETTKTLTERVTPIEKGGTGATTAEEALVKLGVTGYQKPWNVDDNVGCISLNPAKFSMSTPTQAGSEGYAQKDWYMINSGDIYISSTVYPIAEGQSYGMKSAFSYFCVEVKINDDVVYSYEFDKISSSLEGPSEHHIYKKLSVKKGDIVSLALRGIRGNDSSNIGATGRAEFCSFYANIETPYTYLNVSEDITSSVINALLGVSD